MADLPKIPELLKERAIAIWRKVEELEMITTLLDLQEETENEHAWFPQSRKRL